MPRVAELVISGSGRAVRDLSSPRPYGRSPLKLCCRSRSAAGGRLITPTADDGRGELADESCHQCRTRDNEDRESENVIRLHDVAPFVCSITISACFMGVSERHATPDQGPFFPGPSPGGTRGGRAVQASSRGLRAVRRASRGTYTYRAKPYVPRESKGQWRAWRALIAPRQGQRASGTSTTLRPGCGAVSARSSVPRSAASV